MKKILTAILLFAAATATAQNQGGLSKQLEVTREYTPRVGQAVKLPIAPDMTDTVRLRPDITYTINSTASATTFATRPFDPARMNASPFEVRRPLYIRAGLGAPLQTALDVYYAPRMRNNRTFGLYANHRAQWSKLTNDIGFRGEAADTYFEAGLFGSKHLDSLENYIISGELAYDYRGYDPYGVQSGAIPQLGAVQTQRMFNNSNLGFYRDRLRGHIAIGDNFLDLSHFNYRVGLTGAYSRVSGEDNQADFDFNFRAAQMFGATKNQGFEAVFRVRGAIDLDDRSGYWTPDGRRYSPGNEEFEMAAGNMLRDPDWIPEGSAVTVTVEPRYVLTGRIANMKLGVVARYVNNKAWSQNYLAFAPTFEASANFAGGSFVPFLNYSSHMVDGSAEAISRRNPYMYLGYSAPTGWVNDARLGFSGDLNDVFTYRVSGGISLFNDYHIFTAVQEVSIHAPQTAGAPVDVHYLPTWFEPFDKGADGARFTLGAELGMQGMGGFSGRVYGNWNRFNFSGVWEDFTPVGDLAPWDGGIEIAYNHRKLLNVRFDARIVGARDYNVKYLVNDFRSGSLYQMEPENAVKRIKPVIDISLAGDYELMNDFWVFLECRNLAGMRLYQYPTYRGHGASIMAGIKVVF
jgi:hypothetical protein